MKELDMDSSINEFKNEIYPNLTNCLETDKETRKESIKRVFRSEEQHDECARMIRNQFKQLQTILINQEALLLKTLEQSREFNKELNESINNETQNNQVKINELISKYKDEVVIEEIVGEDENQLTQDIELTKKLINSKSRLSEFLVPEVIKKKELISQINYDILTLHRIEAHPVKEFIAKAHRIGVSVYYQFENGMDIPTEGLRSIAFGPDSSLTGLIIPNNITSILFLDGFNDFISNSLIPPSVTSLTFQNIKYPLGVGCIPSTVISVNLMNDFEMPLFRGVIPGTLDSLAIHNIKSKIEYDSIPKSLKTLYVSRYFKQPLNGLVGESTEVVTNII